MKQYFKNILKNIMKNKASYLGVIVIIALGIFIYIGMDEVLLNLRDKVDTYFNDYNYADVFATVNEMPEKEVEKLQDIEGIDVAFGRLSENARLLLKDKNEIIILHLLAYDKDDSLNQLSISTNGDELDNMFLIGSKMFDTYKFKTYDDFQLIIGDETKTFTLAGTVKAPEYLYAVPTAGAQMQDSEVYDIACMPKDKLEKLLGKKGMVTELGFKLKDGYTFDDIKHELTERLEPYGLTSITDRKDQASYYRLNEEFSQLTSVASAVPIIFMLISIFMMYIILKKMIDRERSLIGTMKAFGFSDGELILAYMKQGIGIGILGSLLGGILSIPLGKFVFSMYKDYFNLPYNDFKFYASTRTYGTIIALGTSLIATYVGIKDVLKINPAESMRQVVPSFDSRFTIPEFIAKILNSRQKMSIRTIFRNKFRNFVIMLAIALPFGLTAVLSSFPAVAEQVFFNQFTKIQTYDLQIAFNGYEKYYDAASAVEQIDYTYDIEPIVQYGINIKKDNISKQTALIGLNKESDIYRIMDIHDKYYEPSDNGIIINSNLARKLNASVGDEVGVTNNYLSPVTVMIPIVNIIDESFGENCYINIDAIPKYFNVPRSANSVIFKVENGNLDYVKKVISDTKNILYVTDTQRNLKSYKDMMESMLAMMNIFSVLSIVAGIILIYNISDISIRERKNEFGTLSILGTTFKEITEIICFEQAINFVFGIILGFPVSLMFKKFMAGIIATDIYTIDLKIFPSSYFMSLCICLAIMLLSMFSVLRNIKNIDSTDILKERE